MRLSVQQQFSFYKGQIRLERLTMEIINKTIHTNKHFIIPL